MRIYHGRGDSDISNTFEIFNTIANVSIRNLTGLMTEDTDYALEMTDDGNVEIELRNVSLSKYSGVSWWNITLNFYDFENRQTVALEGISNKTGTFHLDVNCPAIVDKGSTMNCSISAQVEDSEVVEKEVDFTCYVYDGVTEYSSLNFNQMINRTLFTTSREFLVPSSFNDGTQYVLQCHADYYNLGGRRDSFYDTFVTSGVATSSGGSSSTRQGDGGASLEGSPTITGKTIEEGEENSGGEGIIHFIPNGKWEWIASIVILLIIIGTLFILLRKRAYRNLKSPHLKIFVSSILIIILLFVGGIYGYRFVKNKFIDLGNIASYSLTSDPLFRGIIFTIFIVLIIIILFKTLNIQMDIRLGDNFESKRYYEDKKTAMLQHKINQEILRHELARAKREK